VNGLAAGGRLGLAMVCDWRAARRDLQPAFTEIGYSSDFGGHKDDTPIRDIPICV
jgi:enoyl-CoA hydratase/carnithine racemase